MANHRYSKPPSRLRKFLLAAATIGAGWVAGHIGQHPETPVPMSQTQASGQAQTFANDILKQCSLTPSLGTQLCGEAADVAVTPIHDGKDGKDGKSGLDGINGVNGANGIDGHNGRDGSVVKAQIFHHPDGTSEYCPRSGGTDLYPVFDCISATVVQKKTSSSDN